MTNAKYNESLDFILANINNAPMEHQEHIYALLSTASDYPDLDDREYEEMLQFCANELNLEMENASDVYSYEYICAVKALAYFRTKDKADNWGETTYFGYDNLYDPEKAEVWRKQRIERGFDDTETWAFDELIYKWFKELYTISDEIVAKDIDYFLDDEKRRELSAEFEAVMAERINDYIEENINILEFAKFIQPRLDAFLDRGALKGVPGCLVDDGEDWEDRFTAWQNQVKMINEELKLYIKEEIPEIAEAIRSQIKYIMLLND